MKNFDIKLTKRFKPHNYEQSSKLRPKIEIHVPPKSHWNFERNFTKTLTEITLEFSTYHQKNKKPLTKFYYTFQETVNKFLSDIASSTLIKTNSLKFWQITHSKNKG